MFAVIKHVMSVREQVQLIKSQILVLKILDKFSGRHTIIDIVTATE